MPTPQPESTSALLGDPDPQPVVTLGPDDVDPAKYPSHGIDTVNGGIRLPGVEFRSNDGRIVCGIFTWGHLTTPAGTASCTVDTFRSVFPQPSTDTGPWVQSVMVDALTGAYGLYPDWFAQPARAIPVLAAGKSIRYEGTVCSATADTITCTINSTGHGFTLSPTAYTRF